MIMCMKSLCVYILYIYMYSEEPAMKSTSSVYVCFLSLKAGFKTRFNPSSLLLNVGTNYKGRAAYFC